MKWIAYIPGMADEGLACARGLAPQLQACVLNRVLRNADGDIPQPYGSVIEAWSEGGEPPRFPAVAAVYGVEELVEKRVPGLFPPQGVKLVCAWQTRPGVPAAEARRHWNEHVPLALRIHTGACGYTRNWVTAPPSGQAFQGIATLWFPHEDDLRLRLFPQPEDFKTVMDDVADFIGDSSLNLVTSEQVVKAP
jgi:hypothetical protein